MRIKFAEVSILSIFIVHNTFSHYDKTNNVTKLKFLLSAIGCLLVGASLVAQELNVEHLKDMRTRNLGPAGMSGRVTSIDVDLSNPDIIYAGTASGGLWRSESGGIDWEPIFEDQPTQSIGAVAVSQKNPSVIWVGTGEGNPRNSHNSGRGIFKSIDGGKNWMDMGLTETRNIHRVIIHPDNPEVVFVGAMGSIWGNNEERGVYRTTDGGESWEKVLYVDDSTGIADLVVDPTNPDKLIAAMWTFGRKPWTFNSGGSGSGIYVSFDGGDTWKKRTDEDGLPKGDLGRIGLAIAPSKPNIVYALVEAKENALYKSTDGGFNWRKIATDKENIGNRPFYYSDIYVDPMNENRVYSLYSLVSRSEDGGKTFDVILPYSGVHPDHHTLWIHPEDPDFLINGNDGGMNISRDGGDNWRFIENLPLAQFYHISYDMDIPYNIAGGMQDNGSWVGPSAVWKPGGIRNADWQEVYFGDGFDVVFKPSNNRYVYAMSQGGNVGFVDRKTGRSKNIRPTHPENVPLRFNWNAAIAKVPGEDCGVYYGSQFVHKSLDCGETWEIISPDLTTNDTLKQQQDKSGGLTIDDTEAENHTTILAIEPSPVRSNVIWVGTDDGNLQITRNGGQNWENVADRLPDVNPGSWIPYIEASTRRPGEAFIIVNDYRRNDWRPMAFHTDDYGESFTRIVDEDKVDGYTMAIVQDPIEENLLFLGTDYGLYISIDKGESWTKWNHDFPSAPVIDLQIHPREHDLIIGTFGRAAWILDDIRPLREIARTQGDVLEKPFAAFQTPDAYLAEFRSYDGVRFTADAVFQGDNRYPYGLISLWVKPELSNMDDEATEEKEEAEEEEMEADETEEQPQQKSTKRPKKVKVQVLNMKHDTIRTYTTELDTGLNRIYWNLRMDGVRYPSRRAPRPDADAPSGAEVFPGTYKLLFTYGDWKDSTLLTVHPDPRYDIPMGERQAKMDVTNEFYSLVEKATHSFQQLQDARKTIRLVNEAMTNAPDSTKKEITKVGKALQDSIVTIEKLYMQPTGLKGIQRSSDNLQYRLYRTSSYISALDGRPTQAVEHMMNTIRAELEGILEQVNDFFEEDFAGYQEQVEAVQYSLFKEVEPVELD